MIWTRKELKDKAKASIKRNYWGAVLGGIVAGLLTAGTAASSASKSDELSTEIQETISNMDLGVLLALIGILLSVLAVAWIVSMVVKVFVSNPLRVGVSSFFTKQSRSEEKVSVKELISGFTNGYINNVKALFFRDLFVALWSLLFVIPGIIKSYQWMMVPYIMADDPTMDAKAARDLSRSMMDGHKWNTFVLELSFIPWALLGGITFGLVQVFYVSPYMEFTKAELYRTLKNEQ